MAAPLVVDRFGGLQLVSDPQEVGADNAIDLLNVDLDQQGRVRTRDGFLAHTNSEGTNRYDSLTFFEGENQIVAGAGNRLESLSGSSSATVLASSTAPTASPHYFAQFGTPTASKVYIANGTDQIRAYDGLVFSSPAGLANEKGRVLAAWQARLVHACTPTHESRVSFSNAGDPETFTYGAGPPETGDFVDVSPGDGEPVTALAVWDSYLFAFKRTKFAVFTQPSTDATGGAIFNYRLVGTGAGATGPDGVCVAPEGVYFVGRDGMYFTSGGPPQYVSKALEPLFREDTPTFYGGEYLRSHYEGTSQLAYCERRVYMSAAEQTADAHNKLFVYDTDTREWAVWGVDASALTVVAFSTNVRSRVAFAYSTGLKHIGAFAASQTTDAGTPISWRYRSGSYDFGVPDQEKFTRSIALWGSGTVTVQVAVDMGDPDTGSALVLGTAPAVARGQQDFSHDGYLFSHRLSGTGVAKLHRLVHTVRSVRGEGVR